MLGLSRVAPALCALLVVYSHVASAHTIISYPPWRGNNLHTNGTAPEFNPDSIGIDHYSNGSTGFPYGMQFMFPCGGMPMTTNRTKWPYQGGALAFQPGWNSGHQTAFIYVNMGVTLPGQQAPVNYTNVVVPAFEITGPNNTAYPGTVCLPQVPMPADMSLQIGDNVTIQVIETTQYGAALYSCADVTLADPSEVEEVTPQNCFNSSDISFELVFSTQALASRAAPASKPAAIYSLLSIAIASAVYALW